MSFHGDIRDFVCLTVFKTPAMVSLGKIIAGVVDTGDLPLKVHKNENFFGFDFEICTFS
jgi:hypothetical protein